MKRQRISICSHDTNYIQQMKRNLTDIFYTTGV